MELIRSRYGLDWGWLKLNGSFGLPGVNVSPLVFLWASLERIGSSPKSRCAIVTAVDDSAREDAVAADCAEELDEPPSCRWVLLVKASCYARRQEWRAHMLVGAVCYSIG